MLKDLDIDFLFVIDGMKLKAKLKTDKLRETKRNKYKELHNKCKLKRSLRKIRCSGNLCIREIQQRAV